MLSTHTVKSGALTFDLKMSTRAMMRIEREFETGLANALQSLEGDDLKISSIVRLFAAIMNDGRGATEDEAADAIDSLGVIVTAEAIAAATEIAFPELSAGAAPGKNRKRAAG